MGELLLFGLGIPVLVTMLVQLGKALGFISDASAPWWAFLSGVGFSYLANAVVQFPQIIPYIQPLIYGLVIFAAATGIYHAGKNVLGKDHEPKP